MLQNGQGNGSRHFCGLQPKLLLRALGDSLPIFTALLCSFVFAQTPWPAKPAPIIIPVPPGGSQDMLGRGASAGLSAIWGQPVMIESRPGAGGITAADAVAKSAVDGYAAERHALYLQSIKDGRHIPGQLVLGAID